MGTHFLNTSAHRGVLILLLVFTPITLITADGHRDYSCSGGQCLFSVTDKNGKLKEEVLNCEVPTTCKVDERCSCTCIQAGGSYVAKNVCAKMSPDEIASCGGSTT